MKYVINGNFHILRTFRFKQVVIFCLSSTVRKALKVPSIDKLFLIINDILRLSTFLSIKSKQQFQTFFTIALICPFFLISNPNLPLPFLEIHYQRHSHPFLRRPHHRQIILPYSPVTILFQVLDYQ